MVAVSLKEVEAPRFMRAAEGLQLTLPMTIKSLALQRLKQLEDGESVLAESDEIEQRG